MLKKTLIASILMIIILTLATVRIYNARILLFYNMPWLLAVATGLGIILGILRGIKNNDRTQSLNRPPDRHTIDSFLEHWGAAVGVLILIISGFFLIEHYKRGFATNLHFLGLVITLFFSSYFWVHFFAAKKYKYLLPGITDIIDGTIKKYLLRTFWQDKGKYLSSQKSAFLAFLFLGFGVFLSGAIKLAHYYLSIPGQLILVATQVHDYLGYIFVLMLLIHLLLTLSVSSNRRLLTSLFTGKLKYKENLSDGT